MALKSERKGLGYLRTCNKLLWCSSFPVNSPSAGEGPAVARRLEDAICEPWWTAPSLTCLKQRDSNLAPSFSELTGKQWNSFFFLIFCIFFKERERRGEKNWQTHKIQETDQIEVIVMKFLCVMAKTVIYLWLARQSIMCLQWKLLFYPESWTEGNETSGTSWLEKGAGVNSAWSTETLP